MASHILDEQPEVYSRGQPADCPTEDSSWESQSSHSSNGENPQVSSARYTQSRNSEEAVCRGEPHASSDASASGSPDHEGDVFICLGDHNATSGSETESWTEEYIGGAQSDGSEGAVKGVTAAGAQSPGEDGALLNGESQADSGAKEQDSSASGTDLGIDCKMRVFQQLLLLTFCLALLSKYSEVFFFSSTLVLGAVIIYLLAEKAGIFQS